MRAVRVRLGLMWDLRISFSQRTSSDSTSLLG